MTYKWRTFDYSVSAQAAGEHMEELDKQYGEVTPQIMVDDARPEGALMHPLYEWNDDIAAEKYRRNQAKKIASDLVIVHVAQNEEVPQEPIRAFVSVKPRNEKASFRPIVKALSDKDTKEQVIANAKLELEAYERKYRGIVDIIPILEEMIARLTT